MRLLADAFCVQSPDTTVKLMQGVGSSGAIKAVRQGALDVGLSARVLTSQEQSSGISATLHAGTVVVFAVSSKSKVGAITLDEAADIYSGRMVSWPDGSQIRPVLPPAGESISIEVKRMAPGVAKAMLFAEKLPGIPYGATDQEVAEKIERIPGALGVTTLSLILSENRGLRALTLNGIEPSTRNGASGKYPYAIYFHLVVKAGPSEAINRFVAFVQSPAGRDILVRSGHWVP